jgi:hypothetical protein
MDEDFEAYVAEHNARVAAWERFENKRTDWQVYDHLINEEMTVSFTGMDMDSDDPSTHTADKSRRRRKGQWHG